MKGTFVPFPHYKDAGGCVNDLPQRWLFKGEDFRIRSRSPKQRSGNGGKSPAGPTSALLLPQSPGTPSRPKKTQHW